jgi:hypothetical protein
VSRFVANRAKEIRFERGGNGQPGASLPERGKYSGNDVTRFVGVMDDVERHATERRPVGLEAPAKQYLVTRADSFDEGSISETKLGVDGASGFITGCAWRSAHISGHGPTVRERSMIRKITLRSVMQCMERVLDVTSCVTYNYS